MRESHSPNKEIAKKPRYFVSDKEAPPERTRRALPRKIACGDICGDPEGTLYQMPCEFKEALTVLFAQRAFEKTASFG